MARQFLRQNNLHNVVGRIEYIRGDTGKQENMMAYYSTMPDEDWKNLAQYNQERFKKNKKGFIKNAVQLRHENLYCIFHMNTQIVTPTSLLSSLATILKGNLELIAVWLSIGINQKQITIST